MYITLPNSEKEGKVYDLATYMQIRMKDTKEHEIWALKFFICECLNFINVICQIFITDAFLGGEFSTYGTEVRILDLYFFVKRKMFLISLFPNWKKMRRSFPLMRRWLSIFTYIAAGQPG